MDIDEKIRICIKEIKGGYFSDEEDLMSRGLLSSFDLMELLVKLEDMFQIELPLESIVPENFDSISEIKEMILQGQGKVL